MFGTNQLRSTLHRPSAARWPLVSTRPVRSEAVVSADLLRRVEHTLAAEAAATRHAPAGVDLARPLSLAFDPVAGVLRLEFAAPALPCRHDTPIEAIARHLAALLALDGVTRIEAHMVDAATGAILDARTIEARTIEARTIEASAVV